MYEHGGFTAGTLVRTDSAENYGLKRIEEIKIGDNVLCMPELHGGEQVFKKVLNKFEFNDQEIWLIETGLLKSASTSLMIPPATRFGVTANQRFWLIGYASYSGALESFTRVTQPRWMRVDQIPEDGVVLADLGVERLQYVVTARPLSLYADDLKLAWLQGGYQYKWRYADEGSLYDLSSGEGVSCFQPEVLSCFNGSPRNEEGEYPPYCATVYNIEVEDYHTYFIGVSGIWVRHAAGG